MLTIILTISSSKAIAFMLFNLDCIAYICLTPKGPYCFFNIETPLPNLLSNLFQSKKFQLESCLNSS